MFNAHYLDVVSVARDKSVPWDGLRTIQKLLLKFLYLVNKLPSYGRNTRFYQTQDYFRI